MENNNEVLLKVDHLCQYFRMGRKDLKAVDDVSFEIKKGESSNKAVENISDFKGQKISAGTRSYKDAIANARSEAAKKIKALRAEKDASPERAAQIKAEIEKIHSELGAVVDENRAKIAYILVKANAFENYS